MAADSHDNIPLQVGPMAQMPQHRNDNSHDCFRTKQSRRPVPSSSTVITQLFICLVIYISLINSLHDQCCVTAFDEIERILLRDEAKSMFLHAYKSYIITYPADEILPISCQGRYRRIEDSSDIDDSIGNFSLTLVDSLDTLVIMGEIDEFESALKRLVQDLSFDSDIVVSVFETNIRMLGGLLSAHILATLIKKNSKLANMQSAAITSSSNSTSNSGSTGDRLVWYDRQILDLADDLGRRLLPAFETKTGIPHPRVNLRHGMNHKGLKAMQETCTACAGSLILEFATLSRLTGDPVYEEKARRSMDAIWEHRHHSTDLVGTVLNIDSGEWVRRESGIGAGSDSYYEYCLKAYILLGDEVYLERFNRHYDSVMRYISRGPFLIDVHMHRPARVAKGFMDALSAFWPGLQVLKGDLRSAIMTHAMFNEVVKRHKYLPEAFTTDLQVYWAHHQLRPEFLESTYFLHRATNEDYYLEVGKNALRNLQKLRVDCGFAGLKDVRTQVHDDRMASFVLAETLKYLYLLFSASNETVVNLNDYIFSTEGHLFPLELNTQTLKSSSQSTTPKSTARKPNPKRNINSNSFKHMFRGTIADYEDTCPSLEAQNMRQDSSDYPLIPPKRMTPVSILWLTEL